MLFFCENAGIRLFRQERIAIVGGGHKRLLDAAGADPAHQVEDTAGLVVGA